LSVANATSPSLILVNLIALRHIVRPSVAPRQLDIWGQSKNTVVYLGGLPRLNGLTGLPVSTSTGIEGV